MTMLLLIGFAPMIAMAALAMLPLRRWALLSQGLYWLAMGLIALDEHARPFGEDNDRFGLGALILGAWLFAGVVGLLLSMRRLPAESDRSRAALWPVPVGTLVAVLFLHWLSNRLAGATPAWLVHVTVFGVALGNAAVIWKVRPRLGTRRNLAHLAVVAAVTVSALVAWAALEAASWGARAREIANGAPYCLLTFAGRDHPRPAASVLELSSLVSRSGGRSAFDDAHWLVVAGPKGVTAKRYRTPWGRAAYFEDRRGPAACSPRIGGRGRTAS